MKHKQRDKAYKRNSGGYLLIEVAIALAIIGIAMYYQFSQMHEELIAQAGKAQGQNLLRLAEGDNAYATTYYNQILNNLPISLPTGGNVAVNLEPTTAELSALGLLAGNFSSQAFTSGSSYATVLKILPSGCVPASGTCTIGGYAYISKALKFGGSNSPSAIGEAIKAVGADGGTNIFDKTIITGYRNGWSMANPLPVAQQETGQLFVALGANSTGFTQFYRRDGSLPLTASFNMGGQSITGIKSVASGGVCTTTGDLSQEAGTGIVLSCQSGSWTKQGSSQWKTPVANYASLPVADNVVGDVRITTDTGRAFTWTGAAWAALSLDQNGNFTASGKIQGSTIQPSYTATENTSDANCIIADNSTWGKLAKNTAGVSLYCDSGIWKKPAAGGSSFVSAELGNPAVSTRYWAAHGLGAVPTVFLVKMRCKAADHGYSINDEVLLFENGATRPAGMTSADATVVNFVTDTNPSFQVISKNFAPTGWDTITPANWQIFLVAVKF